MIISSEIDGLWNIGDPNVGLQALHGALESHPECADELRTQIARALGLLRRFEEAWTESSKLSAEHSSIVEVRLQLESGRLKSTSRAQANTFSHVQSIGRSFSSLQP